MGPQLINNDCAVMRNLGKPLRDSERCPHVWQQAGRLTEGDDAGSRDGLRSATSNLGRAESHTNHPAGFLHHPHLHLLPFTAEGFPLTFGFSGGHFWTRCLSFPALEFRTNGGFTIDQRFFFVLNIAGRNDGGSALF